MLKRDSLTAQMQQLSHTLAKVKRLILEDQEPRALEEIRYTLSHYYGLTDQDLLNYPEDAFIARLRELEFKAEEVNMLAAFLDELAGLHDDDLSRTNLWTKVLRLYDMLEHDFHFLSFENLGRRQLLQQAIGNA